MADKAERSVQPPTIKHDLRGQYMTEGSPRNIPWAWIIVVLLGGVVLFLAWDRFGSGGKALLAEGQGVVAEAVGTSAQWAFTDETDEMTDEQILSAYREIEADGFIIEATISCRPSSNTLTYSFLTFGSDREPRDAKPQFSGNNLNPFHQARIRIDDNAPNFVMSSNPRYSNIFEFSSRNGQFYFKNEMRTASRILFELALNEGQPTFSLDQTDENVARVVGPCSADSLYVAAQKQAQIEEANKPKEFTITNSTLTTSGLSSAGVGVEEIVSFCVGDEIIVRNDTTRDVRLRAALYASDDHADLGTASAGGDLRFRAEDKVDAVITSEEHPTLRFRYRVSEC